MTIGELKEWLNALTSPFADVPVDEVELDWVEFSDHPTLRASLTVDGDTSERSAYIY